jgi:hypothetical protein
MLLSQIRRILPKLQADSNAYAALYRRSVALTLNLENDNCIQGAVRALLLQQQLLNDASRRP